MTISTAAVPDVWPRHPFVLRLKRYIDLSDSDVASLWRLIETELTVNRRRDLVVDGYEYRKLCFIEDGYAARYKLLRNGRRQIINVLVPGDVIGLPVSFLQKASYSVISISEMRLQVCPIDDYVSLCYKRPQFGLALSWLAVEEAMTYAEHIIDAGRRTPTERLAHFLLEIHARLMAAGRASKLSFDLPFSQEVMGDALGLSVPHLNRTLAKLRADGLISISNHRVEFLDLNALEMLGHFQPVALTRVPVPSSTEVHDRASPQAKRLRPAQARS
jgi:CRP-like cAMP-binding protein